MDGSHVFPRFKKKIKMETLGRITIVLIVLFVNPVIRGYTFAKLWLWFIVPTFHMNPVRIAEAIGVLLVFGFIFAKKEEIVKRENLLEVVLESVVFTVFLSGFALVTGMIIKLFL